MNICIATSAFPVNRGEQYHRFIDDLIKILLDHKHTVTVLTQVKKGQVENFHPGIEVVRFPWRMTDKEGLAGLSLRKIKDIRSSVSLLFNGTRCCRKITIEKKIDLFICLWVIPSGFYVFAKNIFFKRTPYVLWALGSDVYNYKDNFFSRILLRLIIRQSKAVFADGFELCEIVKGISGRNCAFLPTFHELEVPVERSLPHKGEGVNFSFLFVGRLAQVKGVDVLIDAIKILKDKGISNFFCTIVGDGDLMESLVDRVKANGLEFLIHFEGRVADPVRMSELFSGADCVLIPSRSESIPIVLSEALQFNLPMIVTNAGDMGRIVRENRLGYVVPAPDPVLFAEGLMSFMNKPLTLDIIRTAELKSKLVFMSNHQLLLDSLIK